MAANLTEAALEGIAFRSKEYARTAITALSKIHLDWGPLGSTGRGKLVLAHLELARQALLSLDSEMHRFAMDLELGKHPFPNLRRREVKPMAKNEEANEWELTEEEKREFEDIAVQRRALLMMAEAQYLIAIKISKVEDQWWRKVAKRLELDLTKYPGFSASVLAGKITRK